jgi:hypothetical protein
MTAEIEPFDDTSIELLHLQVEALWAKVFESVTTVIRQTKVFSFNEMGVVPTPNIHQMLARLQLFDSVIDVLLKNAPVFGLEYEQTRPLLNCKVQVANMEKLAAALDAKDKEGYDAAVKALEQQAPF